MDQLPQHVQTVRAREQGFGWLVGELRGQVGPQGFCHIRGVRDDQIEAKDLRIDVFRSSGPGGQSVNTTDSAVRVTHVPSGVVVQCQDEKSQHKNKAKALKVLRARLLEHEQRKAQAERASERRSQVGSGERSEKIRTYNFPQTRVTDHRAGVTIHKLGQVLEGELDELLDAVAAQMTAKSAGGGAQ